MTKTTTLIRSAVLLLAIGFASPAVAQATYRAPPSAAPSTLQAFRAGPLVGMEFANGDTGFAIRGDLSFPLSRLSPKGVNLEAVVSAGLSWFSYGHGYYDGADVTLFKLIPALRVTVPLTPTVGLYGDAGLGFYFDSVDYAGYGDDGVGAALRFAGGAFADVTPVARLGVELGVNPYFGDYSETNVSLLFSAMFRF